MTTHELRAEEIEMTHARLENNRIITIAVAEDAGVEVTHAHVLDDPHQLIGLFGHTAHRSRALAGDAEPTREHVRIIRLERRDDLLTEPTDRLEVAPELPQH